MCKILINCHANDIRRRSNKDIEYVESVPEMPEDGVARVVEVIDANILREAVERLPPDMKEVVLLRYFMDMPILKVAQILAQPVGTVKSRLYYARVLLGMRLGAKLKKSGVALIVAALLLLGATAAVVGIRQIATLGGANESSRDDAIQDAAAENGSAQSPDASVSVGRADFSAPNAPESQGTSTTQNGEETMTGRKAAAAALTAVMAATAPCESIDPPYGATSSCATEYIELDARALTCRATDYISLYTVPFKGIKIIIF